MSVAAVNGKKRVSIDWSLRHQWHLDSEVILRAMPKGSFFNIKTRTNGKEYCWVMSPPNNGFGDLDKSFEQKRRDLIEDAMKARKESPLERGDDTKPGQEVGNQNAIPIRDVMVTSRQLATNYREMFPSSRRINLAND